tara:strand:- start:849 stop:1412 length:564 start_codon:yes stop_codon:yes gene_type:complete
MTQPGQPGQDPEVEYRPTAATGDPAAAAQNTTHDEPLDVDGYEKEYIEIKAHGHASSQTGPDKISKELDEKRPHIDRTKSHATTTSAFSTNDSQIDGQEKNKPWHKKLNPLRWGQVPPVPEERTVSREYTASFLSQVYFQWVAPIMSVSCSSTCLQRVKLIASRLVTSGPSNKMTSGQSIPIDQQKP